MLKNAPQSNPNFSPRMNPLGLPVRSPLGSGLVNPAIPPSHLGMPTDAPPVGRPLPLGGNPVGSPLAIPSQHLGLPAGRGIKPLPGVRPDLTAGDNGMQPQRAGLYGMPRRSMNMNAMSPMY